MRKRIFGGVLILLAVAVFFWWRSRESRDAAEIYGIVESRRVEAGSRLGGRVVSVLVEEGEEVKEDTALIELDISELDARWEQARARKDEAQARVKQLTRGLRPEEIDQAEAAAAQARAQYEAVKRWPRPEEFEQARAELRAADAEMVNAGANFARFDALRKSGDISTRAWDDARARRDAARARAEAAGQRVRLFENGSRPEDLEAARQRVVQAEKAARLARLGARDEEVAQARAREFQAEMEMKQIDVQLRDGTIRARRPSRVESISVRPGDIAAPNRVLVTLLEAGVTYVRAFVPEPDLANWRVGGKVEVSLDHSPGWIAGDIQQIAAQAEFLPRNVQTREDRTYQVFGVKIRVIAPDGVLKSGMAARVRRTGSR